MDYGRSWEEYLHLTEYLYNNSYQSSIEMVPFKALYGRFFLSPLCWAEIGEKVFFGPEFVKDTKLKVKEIRKRLLKLTKVL